MALPKIKIYTVWYCCCSLTKKQTEIGRRYRMQIIFPHLNVTNCRFWLAERILRKQNDWNLIEQSTMLWVCVHSLEIKKRVSEHWAFQYLEFYFFGKLENGVCVRQINYVNAISKYLPSNNIYWILGEMLHRIYI